MNFEKPFYFWACGSTNKTGSLGSKTHLKL
jgi:hypothetical protein